MLSLVYFLEVYRPHLMRTASMFSILNGTQVDQNLRDLANSNRLNTSLFRYPLQVLLVEGASPAYATD
jgi:hypothetical protein